MTTLSLIILSISYVIMIIFIYRMSWFRLQKVTLDRLIDSLKKNNIDLFVKYMATLKPPILYEPFLTEKQIKKLKNEKKSMC